MLKVDSHQHFWIFDQVRDSWITPDMQNIRRDFLPKDLKPILDENNIAACVAVQADQSETETSFLLDLAESNSFVKGVVGWIDLRSNDIEVRLDYFRRFPKLKGFRHIVQAEGTGFMLDPQFLKGIAALATFGFTYDILVNASQLKEVVKLVQQTPEQNFVLDHLGKPHIKAGEIKGWASDIKALAEYQNVFCKLSGMVTEADPVNWQKEEMFPYLDVVVNSFGVERLMFGSDWPVCKLAAEYKDVCDVISNYVAQFSAKQQEQIWSGNAVRFYNLEMDLAE